MLLEDNWFNVGKLDRCNSHEGICSVVLEALMSINKVFLTKTSFGFPTLDNRRFNHNTDYSLPPPLPTDATVLCCVIFKAFLLLLKCVFSNTYSIFK